jgi:hypothetical protein
LSCAYEEEGNKTHWMKGAGGHGGQPLRRMLSLERGIIFFGKHAVTLGIIHRTDTPQSMEACAWGVLTKEEARKEVHTRQAGEGR